MSAMQPGHENCSYATIEERTLGGTRVHSIICRHDHREEIRATDALGDGPVIGWHCQCCDRIIRHEDYL